MIAYAERLDNLSGRVITEATIKSMHEQVRLAKQDWAWISHASWVVRRVPSKAYLAEGRQLFSAYHATIWRTGYLAYRRDPHQVEAVAHPWLTLERRAGDCDDWATLYASLAGALGFPYRFKTINADPARPSQPSHVYTQILVPGSGWISSDLTVKNAAFGWEAQGYKFELWPEPRYD